MQMQASDKSWLVLAAGLVVIALVVRLVAPSTNIFIGVASRFFRISTVASWLLLFTGIALGALVLLRAVRRVGNP